MTSVACRCVVAKYNASMTKVRCSVSRMHRPTMRRLKTSSTMARYFSARYRRDVCDVGDPKLIRGGRGKGPFREIRGRWGLRRLAPRSRRPTSLGDALQAIVAHRARGDDARFRHAEYPLSETPNTRPVVPRGTSARSDGSPGDRSARERTRRFAPAWWPACADIARAVAHGPPSRFVPRNCSDTNPFVTRFFPLRYRDLPAGQTHVRASASYVKSSG